jgi:hypothetical protein
MSESDINFKALKKIDPYIKNINLSCSNVALYNFNTHKAEWEKTEVEGTLFLFEREAEPKYGFTIMNRLNPENHIEPVTGQLDFQIQPPFLLYKNSESEIRGLWFYSGEECQKIGNRIQELVKEVEREQEARKSRKAGAVGGGLTALFQKADAAMKQEEALKQQTSPKQNNLIPNSASADTGKNLLRLLSQPENNNHLSKPSPPQMQPPKEETTESVNAFFAMASSSQQMRVTPQPVMNGGQPGGGVNLSSGGVVGLPGHDHGRGVGLPGHGVGVGGSSVEGGMLNPAALGLHHHSMFGMPGVIQALPISQGLAMGAVPVGGFTPLVVAPGGNPARVPSGQHMHGLINTKPTGAMTVESLEAEHHRNSLSPRSQDPHISEQTQSRPSGKEQLGDLSSKLKEQLGVKMATSVQKSVSHPQPTSNHATDKNGPVLMSPLVFSQSATSTSTVTQSADLHRNLAGNHQQLFEQQMQSLEVTRVNGTRQTMADKDAHSKREVSALTQRQMVEAMEYLLKHDDSFVEKLHTAYVQSLQQRLK